MNQIEFTTALIRLNRHKVGITEAATLFSLADGATVAQLCRVFRQSPPDIVKGRIQQLRAKKLIESIYDKQGLATYRPTARGRKIIAETLKTAS